MLVEVVPYNPQFKPFIQEWLEARGIKVIDPLPEIGFLAAVDDVPTAVGFLRKVEGGVGWIDSLCSNPEQPSLARHLAIESVVKTLINQALLHRMTALIAYSVDASTLERSKTHGFVHLPHTVIVKKME